MLQQQGRFDSFVHRFNHERPPQALDMKTPSSLYASSTRPYRGLDELDYPFHDWTAVITTRAASKQVGDHVWLVTFMEYDLG